MFRFLRKLKQCCLMNKAEELLKNTKYSPIGIGYDLRMQVADFIIKKTENPKTNVRWLAKKLNMTLDNLGRIMRTQSNLDLMTIAKIYYFLNEIPVIRIKNKEFDLENDTMKMVLSK